MPSTKRRRRSSSGQSTKRARTKHGRRSGSGVFLGGLKPSLAPWDYLRGLLSLCSGRSMLPSLGNPWRSLTRLVDVRWTSLLGGSSAVQDDVLLPDWCAMKDIAYEILSFLDAKSLAQLAAASKSLNPTIRTYARHVAQRSCGAIPLGFASHSLSVGVLGEYPSFAALPLMKEMAGPLSRQRVFQPRSDSLEVMQSERQAGTQHVTRHMRAVLVDWMIEVAVEYRLPTACLHAGVNLMDRCLGAFTVPRSNLQLLGCCCLMLESQRHPSYHITITDVTYICDSQYDEFQVVAMFNIITGNTQAPEELRSAETVHGFLTDYLLRMKLININGPEAPAVGQVSEDVVLANLLADLSLLDYHILRFYPSTLAASIVFLTRLMMQHMSEYRLSVTSMGLLTTQSREVLGLCKYRRPFVERSAAYDEEPWGFPALRALVTSYEAEALAVAFCTAQLWRLHCDFMFHTSGIGDEPYILKAHHFMLKGITDKYCPSSSDRATAWKAVGTVPERVLQDWVHRHLKVTLPPSGGRLPRLTC